MPNSSHLGCAGTRLPTHVSNADSPHERAFQVNRLVVSRLPSRLLPLPHSSNAALRNIFEWRLELLGFYVTVGAYPVSRQHSSLS